MENEVIIKVDHLDKMYKLYSRQRDRVRDALGLGKKQDLYKEHYALKDVSLEVRRGETVGIIGTNGSGKSTILKIITGVLSPTSGDVEINGRISALLELGAGFNMEFTGLENVYLNGTMNGFSEEEIDEKLDAILDFADIGEFVHQQVKTYSSGMFVRLAFALAINIDPEILVVDEALSVGDVFFQNKCYHKFEEFKKEGRTILFVSHDLSSISKYCDRVILLDHGKKMAEGRPKEIIDMYKKVLVNQTTSAMSGSERVGKDGKLQGSLNRNVKDGLWKSYMTLNPSNDTYGSGLAEIEDFCLIDNSGNMTNTVIKGDTCSVKVKVRFHADISEPIIAVSIKNRMGVEITGTNTMFEKLSTGECKDGDEMTAVFTQRMMLQGGDYLISLGLVGYREGSFTVYHRLYDIFNVQVISSKDTVGYYDMDSEVQLFKNGEEI
ncbi:MAG: ABC transporter ATP-binding protein [Lachnospiraceae bacterium]|nr:ABC transporter ATP-binding protein [Lachnospiraceae bacterium]MCR5411000.1 ABC transporter ATP-binding protein [Lachnospiraceae bacterium]